MSDDPVKRWRSAVNCQQCGGELPPVDERCSEYCLTCLKEAMDKLTEADIGAALGGIMERIKGEAK